MPASARGRQVSGKHVEEGVDEAIPVDEPLVGAGSERARPAGRPPRAHGGRTVGGGQRHAAVTLLAQHPPHQLLAQLPIGAHEGQLQPGFEADERRQESLVMLEGQVTLQFRQAQEADAVHPRIGQAGAHGQVSIRGRAVVDFQHARVDLVERPQARVLPDPQVEPPKVHALIQGVGQPTDGAHDSSFRSRETARTCLQGPRPPLCFIHHGQVQRYSPMA